MLKDEILAKIETLVTAQTSLKTNIANKGIVTAENDHIPELPDKIVAIETSGYAVEGETILVTPSYTFSIANIPLKPKEAGILSHTLAESDITTNIDGYVVPFIRVTFDETSDTKTVNECVATRSLDTTTGTWTLTFSFTAYNDEHPTEPIRFQGGYIYTWLVLFHSLYSEDTDG